MNISSTSTAASLQALQTSNEIQMATLNKALDAAETEGAAVIAMLDDVIETMEQAMQQTGQSSRGINIKA